MADEFLIPDECECSSECPALTEAGPQGPAGVGVNGTNGTDGVDAYTTVSTQFIQPAVSASVVADVDNSDWIVIGQIVYVDTGGYYTVAALPSSTSVTLTNLGYTGNAAPGAVIAAGKKLGPAGIKGADSSLTDPVPIANGGTGQTTQTAGFDALSPNTTKGDVAVHNGADNVRQAVGTDGRFLKANSGTGTGVEWDQVDLGDATNITGTLPIGNGGTGSTAKADAFDSLAPATTKGDIIVYNGADNIRLAVGPDTYVLSADSTQASGLVWVPAGTAWSTVTRTLVTATHYSDP